MFTLSTVSALLLRLSVRGGLLAESAILLHLETVRVILFVLHGVVVSLLAFIASECDFYAHIRHLLILPPCMTAAIENLVDAETTWRSAAEMGAKKQPFFTGDVILTQHPPPVNKNFSLRKTFLRRLTERGFKKPFAGF